MVETRRWPICKCWQQSTKISSTGWQNTLYRTGSNCIFSKPLSAVFKLFRGLCVQRRWCLCFRCSEALSVLAGHFGQVDLLLQEAGLTKAGPSFLELYDWVFKTMIRKGMVSDKWVWYDMIWYDMIWYDMIVLNDGKRWQQGWLGLGWLLWAVWSRLHRTWQTAEFCLWD